MWRNQQTNVGYEFLQFVLDRKSGFGALLKADAPQTFATHCNLHSHALATIKLSSKTGRSIRNCFRLRELKTVLWRTSPSASCLKKWALNLSSFCTSDRGCIMSSHACGICFCKAPAFFFRFHSHFSLHGWYRPALLSVILINGCGGRWTQYQWSRGKPEGFSKKKKKSHQKP